MLYAYNFKIFVFIRQHSTSTRSSQGWSVLCVRAALWPEERLYSEASYLFYTKKVNTVEVRDVVYN